MKNLSILLILWSLSAISFSISGQNTADQQVSWPERYSATYGFEAMADHDGKIIVSSVDSTCQAYKLGVRPGMEILGWNTLPVARYLSSMNIRKYRKLYPVMTDQNIKLMLLMRGRQDESVEVFFMTPTGNNWGVRVRAAGFVKVPTS